MWPLLLLSLLSALAPQPWPDQPHAPQLDPLENRIPAVPSYDSLSDVYGVVTCEQPRGNETVKVADIRQVFLRQAIFRKLAYLGPIRASFEVVAAPALLDWDSSIRNGPLLAVFDEVSSASYGEACYTITIRFYETPLVARKYELRWACEYYVNGSLIRRVEKALTYAVIEAGRAASRTYRFCVKDSVRVEEVLGGLYAYLPPTPSEVRRALGPVDFVVLVGEWLPKISVSGPAELRPSSVNMYVDGETVVARLGSGVVETRHELVYTVSNDLPGDFGEFLRLGAFRRLASGLYGPGLAVERGSAMVSGTYPLTSGGPITLRLVAKPREWYWVAMDNRFSTGVLVVRSVERILSTASISQGECGLQPIKQFYEWCVEEVPSNGSRAYVPRVPGGEYLVLTSSVGHLIRLSPGTYAVVDGARLFTGIAIVNGSVRYVVERLEPPVAVASYMPQGFEELGDVLLVNASSVARIYVNSSTVVLQMSNGTLSTPVNAGYISFQPIAILIDSAGRRVIAVAGTLVGEGVASGPELLALTALPGRAKTYAEVNHSLPGLEGYRLVATIRNLTRLIDIESAAFTEPINASARLRWGAEPAAVMYAGRVVVEAPVARAPRGHIPVMMVGDPGMPRIYWLRFDRRLAGYYIELGGSATPWLAIFAPSGSVLRISPSIVWLVDTGWGRLMVTRYLGPSGYIPVIATSSTATPDSIRIVDGLARARKLVIRGLDMLVALDGAWLEANRKRLVLVPWVTPDLASLGAAFSSRALDGLVFRYSVTELAATQAILGARPLTWLLHLAEHGEYPAGSYVASIGDRNGMWRTPASQSETPATIRLGNATVRTAAVLDLVTRADEGGLELAMSDAYPMVGPPVRLMWPHPRGASAIQPLADAHIYSVMAFPVSPCRAEPICKPGSATVHLSTILANQLKPYAAPGRAHVIGLALYAYEDTEVTAYMEGTAYMGGKTFSGLVRLGPCRVGRGWSITILYPGGCRVINPLDYAPNATVEITASWVVTPSEDGEYPLTIIVGGRAIATSYVVEHPRAVVHIYTPAEPRLMGRPIHVLAICALRTSYGPLPYSYTYAYTSHGLARAEPRMVVNGSYAVQTFAPIEIPLVGRGETVSIYSTFSIEVRVDRPAILLDQERRVAVVDPGDAAGFLIYVLEHGSLILKASVDTNQPVPIAGASPTTPILIVPRLDTYAELSHGEKLILSVPNTTWLIDPWASPSSRYATRAPIRGVDRCARARSAARIAAPMEELENPETPSGEIGSASVSTVIAVEVGGDSSASLGAGIVRLVVDGLGPGNLGIAAIVIRGDLARDWATEVWHSYTRQSLDTPNNLAYIAVKLKNETTIILARSDATEITATIYDPFATPPKPTCSIVAKPGTYRCGDTTVLFLGPLGSGLFADVASYIDPAHIEAIAFVAVDIYGIPGPLANFEVTFRAGAKNPS